MALDFHLANNKKDAPYIHPSGSFELQPHMIIFNRVGLPDSRFPLFRRMEDYYKDAKYGLEELDVLINEVNEIVKLYSSNKDDLYSGNLKNCIRLIKNMVADMPNNKKSIMKKLSSYDLASIAYHMDSMLNLSYEMRLGLVEKTREHLNHILHNSYYRDSLDVPDASRKIFDNNEKVDALRILESEFTDLTKAILKDLSPSLSTYNSNIILNKRVA